MPYGLDDDDRGSAASSDNEQDELMEDADDGEAEVDNDADGDGDMDDEEADDNDGDDNEDDERDQDDTQGQFGDSTVANSAEVPSFDSVTSQNDAAQVNGTSPGGSHGPPGVARVSASPRQPSVPLLLPPLYPKVRQEALTASLYDIVPTIAAPHSTSINAVTATPDFRYWFTGGADCYIRKYDGAATINGKTLLTVAQRHPFVDSVTKAGVLMSYWENEEPADTKVKGEEAALSPVYSLAVHREALWLLSGLESGCINLQSVRHDEGKWITSLRKHTSAVSVLTLASDEKSVLSGSWDKNILDWDLNTGQIKREFGGNGGQISAIELRPTSSLPVPRETGEVQVPNGTFSSNNADAPLPNGSAALTNGTKPLTNGIAAGEGGDDAPGSPLDTTSLFGDTDSLFGDDTGGNYGDADGDADDEFSRAIAANTDGQEHQDSQHDVTMTDGDTTLQINGEAALDVPAEPTDSISTIQNSSIPDQPSTPKMPNGLPHAEDLPPKHTSPTTADTTSTATSTPDSSASTFLAASFDGTLCVWDRRQPDPVARIMSRTGGPWCMGACWSPDGNYIYAGRRNNTVEEFSLHKGLKSANRTLKFPAGSGPVSAVRAMPNGRHLICASLDILRLYDLKESAAFKHATVPYLVVPGPPRPGVQAALHIDPTCKYMLSAAGNRGWEGSSTEVLIGYEIGVL